MGRTHRRRRVKKSLIYSENDGSKYRELILWMLQAGYKPTQKLKPKVFASTGRGLMTQNAIKPGDVILSIPESLLISPKVVLQSKLGCYLKRHLSSASGSEILAAFLIWEKSKGKDSYWYPYIATLPASYTTPAFITAKFLSFLPLPAYHYVKDQLEDLQRSYLKMKDLFTSLEKEFPFCQNAFDFETYRWAFYSVNTRCVYKNCCEPGCHKKCSRDLVLVPFLDLLNHNPNVNVIADYCPISKCFQIKSLTPVKKFEQVFINYGPHNNRKLFFEYGFVLENNPHDIIPITTDEVLGAYTGACNKLLSSEELEIFNNEKIFCDLSLSIDGPSWVLERMLKFLYHEIDVRGNATLMFNGSALEGSSAAEIECLIQEIVARKIEEYTVAIASLKAIKECVSTSEDLSLVLNLLHIERDILLKLCNQNK